MRRELKLLDAVRLNSGGPGMTVVWVGVPGVVGVGNVLCRWLDAAGITRECPFPAACLELVEGEPCATG